MLSAFGVEHAGIAKADRREKELVGASVGSTGAAAGAQVSAVRRVKQSGQESLASRKFASEGKPASAKMAARRSSALARSAMKRSGVAIGLSAGGLALAEGASRHREQIGKSAFGVRKAFDPERQRHGRQAAYEGAAAGGSAVAAAGAVSSKRKVAGHLKARKEASEKYTASVGAHAENLHRMANDPGTAADRNFARQTANGHTRLLGHQGRMVKEGVSAVKASRRANKLGAASAGLAAVSVGVHRHAQRGGQSYRYR